MVLWSRKVGLHWLKANRSLISKVVLLGILALLILKHTYLEQSGSGSETLRLWLEYMRSEQKLSSGEFARYLYKKLNYNTSASWIDNYTLKQNLLRVQMGPDEGTMLANIDNLTFYEGDPRLTWSVLVDHLAHSEDGGEEIMFSWYDWSDFYMFNKLASLRDVKINCSFLYETAFEVETLEAAEKEMNDVLFISDRLKYNDPKWVKATRKKEIERKDPAIYSESKCKVNFEKVRFNLPAEARELDDQCRPEVFELQARSRLLNYERNPLSLTMMDGGKTSYRVFVNYEKRQNLLQAGYIKSFLEHRGYLEENAMETKKDVAFDHYATYGEFLISETSKKFKVEIPDTNKPYYNRDLVFLDENDFEVDVAKIIEELEAIENPNSHDKNYLESLKVSRDTNPALAGKFFREAEHIAQFNGMGYHRDKRFFNGALINDPLEYQLRLNALVRNWLKFSRANGLVTWLAHGTLYGQMYNGLTFPWDNDFDVQMPIKHLHLLSRYFNQSLIMEDPREGNGRYFLDVGTSITVRTLGNGLNNIDARFIDVDSGLYVDITGLSVSSTPVNDKFKKEYKEMSKIFDPKNFAKNKDFPELGTGLAAKTIVELKKYADDHKGEFTSDQLKIDDLEKEELDLQENLDKPEGGLTPKERYWMNKALKVYNCRNRHFSTLELLSPLKNTVYHGVPALVPSKSLALLKNEYAVPKQFGFEVYDGKAYLPALQSWFNYNVLKRFANVNSWNANLDRVHSAVSKLAFADIKPLYKNMLKLGYKDLFTICYNAFDVATYRYKEREIEYDDKISKNEKFTLLHTLREEFSPKLASPGKDPYIFNYERRLWRKLGATLTNSDIIAIHTAVETEILNSLWAKHVANNEGKSELFRKINASGVVEIDLNNYGKKITEPNLVWTSDPF